MASGVGLLLIWIMVDDLRRYRIRNRWVGCLILAFVLACGMADRFDLLVSHGFFATAGFAVLACLFSVGLMGGGDAKLLAAALLWTGPEGCLLYSILLLPCAIVYVLGARFAGWPARRKAQGLEIPFGPSIAVAWLAFMVLAVWLDGPVPLPRPNG